MDMVYPIEKLEDLANLFKNTSYSKPSEFFYNITDKTIKEYDQTGYTLKVRNIIHRIQIMVLI